MKQTKAVILFFVTCILSSALYAQPAAQDTLNGVVEEFEVDSNGLVQQISLNVLDKDFNSQLYIIENNSKSAELIDLVGLNVDVIGITKNNSDGTRSIAVVDFIIPEDDDYSLPDDMDEDQ